jgi:hypothetical protein
MEKKLYFVSIMSLGKCNFDGHANELSDEDFKKMATISYTIEDFTKAFNEGYSPIEDEYYVRYL